MSSTHTGIGWTEATWNPITGCSHVSEGCRNCYAEALAQRFDKTALPWTAKNAAVNVRFHERRLQEPLQWRKPRRVFVNSMSDLFHERVADEWLDQIFAVMALCPQHVFQVLTKRPARMRDYVRALIWGKRKIGGALAAFGQDRLSNRMLLAQAFGVIPPVELEQVVPPFRPFPNVWLGVSVENQAAADARIPVLQGTPVAPNGVRFLSCEPLLGPVDLSEFCLLPGDTAALHWVIVGGESGPHHRPMDLDHLAAVVTEAKSWGIPVFVKQDSGRLPGKQGRIPDAPWRQEFPVDYTQTKSGT